MCHGAKIGTSYWLPHGFVFHFIDVTGCGREEYAMLHEEVIIVDDLFPVPCVAADVRITPIPSSASSGVSSIPPSRFLLRPRAGEDVKRQIGWGTAASAALVATCKRIVEAMEWTTRDISPTQRDRQALERCRCGLDGEGPGIRLMRRKRLLCRMVLFWHR
jgi:hypothetical protein